MVTLAVVIQSEQPLVGFASFDERKAIAAATNASGFLRGLRVHAEVLPESQLLSVDEVKDLRESKLGYTRISFDAPDLYVKSCRTD